MKSIGRILKRLLAPEVYLWFFPALMVLPNALLDITEYSDTITKVANVLLPWGVYMILMSLWRNVGRTGALVMLPILFLSGFQVVLLLLYGESIIAVDMFLNLVTTNVSEATELLGNLAGAIFTVCAVYIPTLVWGIVLAVKRRNLTFDSRKRAASYGFVSAVAGLLCIAGCYVINPNFKTSREIFPINVVRNLHTAARRTKATARYYDSSANFSYGASSTRDIAQKEIIVLVLGETSRACNWQLCGYTRDTNPQLSKRDDIVFFTKALSESNTTYKSVPLLLTSLTSQNYGDSIYYTKSIISAFNEGGFRTAFLSNQGRNRSFIDFFAREAQKSLFLRDDGKPHYDRELIAEMNDFINHSPNDKIFIVLHTYGSHFNYTDRYTEKDATFKPDHCAVANKASRAQLMNAYDNTIVYTDGVISDIIKSLEGQHCLSAMLYLSDHGEDIFDDKRGRFLHSSPVPTYYQLHVPMLLWMSSEYRDSVPGLFRNAVANSSLDVSTSNSVFDTLLQLGGIESAYAHRQKSVVDKHFKSMQHYYLNDYNEGVRLEDAGLRNLDFDMLREASIFLE